jgi:molybdopterin synthase sulfur carrier subunit
MQVILFGVLKEKLQSDTLEVVNPSTVGQLIQKIEQLHPLIKEQRYSIAVNKKICSDREQRLTESDIIALLPPFSGG